MVIMPLALLSVYPTVLASIYNPGRRLVLIFTAVALGSTVITVSASGTVIILTRIVSRAREKAKEKSATETIKSKTEPIIETERIFLMKSGRFARLEIKTFFWGNSNFL